MQQRHKEVAAKAALDSIYKRLTKLRSNVELGNLKGKDKIRARVHKLITKKIAKHFDLDIRDDEFRFRIVEQEPAAEAVLNDICKRLESIRSDVKLGKHGGKDNIGVRVGKVINKYKVAKHFVLQIRDDGFDFHIDEHKVASEATLDGIYVIRTSVPEQRLSPDDTVRCYKSLSQVERAFRSIKTIDLKVRPIRHRLETRVRAHIFLCMLAYYVEWHMREAWRPLLFCDEDQEAKKTRDPVAPAKRSEAALRKIRSKKLDDGTEAPGLVVRMVYKLAYRQTEGFLHSIASLLGLGIEIPDYSTLCRRSRLLRKKLRIPKAASTQPIHLMIDSTGLRIHVGTARKPPKQRAWRKLHIAVDRETGNIVASELTASRARDATRVPALLTQIQAPLVSVAADSAYDKEAVYEAIEAHSPGRRTRVVIPPQRNATLSQNSNTAMQERDRHIRAIERHGRREWYKLSGYTKRSMVENAVYRYKAIIGPEMRARTLARQRVEHRIGCEILNKMAALGMPDTYCAG